MNFTTYTSAELTKEARSAVKAENKRDKGGRRYAGWNLRIRSDDAVSLLAKYRRRDGSLGSVSCAI